MASLDADAQQRVNEIWDRGTASTVVGYDIITNNRGIQLCIQTHDNQIHVLQFSPRDALDMAIHVQQDVERNAQLLQALLQKGRHHR